MTITYVSQNSPTTDSTTNTTNNRNNALLHPRPFNPQQQPTDSVELSNYAQNYGQGTNPVSATNGTQNGSNNYNQNQGF